jgi:hypothetical protein
MIGFLDYNKYYLDAIDQDFIFNEYKRVYGCCNMWSDQVGHGIL